MNFRRLVPSWYARTRLTAVICTLLAILAVAIFVWAIVHQIAHHCSFKWDPDC